MFGILSFHVGVWAVQLAPLSAGLGLDPAALGAATLRRFGERRVVLAAGLLAAAGLLTAVTVPIAVGAIGGLLLVGFAIAPVVPTTLSLAG